MDIKKLNPSADNRFSETEKAARGPSSRGTSSDRSRGNKADKVSISAYKFRNNDQLFARLELEKLESSSPERLGELKSEISAYRETRKSSTEEAEKTEIGKKINDSAVWEEIAHKILR